MQKCVGFICLWMRPWPNILQKGYFSVRLWICLQAVWEDARILLHTLFVPLSSESFILSAVQIDCTFCSKHTCKIQAYLFNSFSEKKKKKKFSLEMRRNMIWFTMFSFTGVFVYLFLIWLYLVCCCLEGFFFPQSFARDLQSRRLHKVTKVPQCLH